MSVVLYLHITYLSSFSCALQEIMSLITLPPAASVLKADLKYGKREVAVDENRRDTYKDSYNSASMSELPLDGDPKQLIRVNFLATYCTSSSFKL